MSSFPLENIVHPTDFSLTSEIAFGHALKLAVAARADLRIIHYAEQGVVESWDYFPKVLETLIRWRVLPTNHSKEDLKRLGFQVQGVLATGSDALHSILRNLQQKPSNLLVLATHQIDGLNRWLRTPIAEPLARQSGIPSLFVPPVCQSCINIENGEVNLGRVLLPVDHQPLPQEAINGAFAFTQFLGVKSVEFRLFHVGKDGELPAISLPLHGVWKWKTRESHGTIANRILEEATEFDPHLIVMVTQGHKSLIDVLRGSTTERILRNAQCPVLAIPTD